MFANRFQPVLILVALILVVEFVNLLLGHRLVSWGILPRTFSGLIGIPLAPLLHSGVWHAVSNTVPLFILGVLTLAGGGGGPENILANECECHSSVGCIGVDIRAPSIPRRRKRIGVRLFRSDTGPRLFRTQHHRHRHRSRYGHGVWRTIVGRSPAAKLRFVRESSVRPHCRIYGDLARPQIQQIRNPG